MKKILFFILPVAIALLLGFKPSDRPPGSNNGNNNGNPYRILSNPNHVNVVSSVQLSANQINTWFRNNGSFNRDPTTGNAGFEWPKGQRKFARYASGIWIGALVDGDTLIAVAEYDYEYLPGWIDNNGVPQGKDDANVRMFNISSSDTSDYPAWRQYGVPQGAYTDANGNPFLMGSQTQFCTYTDGYPEAHGNNAGSTAPLNAVILQTNWSYAQNGPLNNMSFTEFRIINRGTQPWDRCYIALWTDDDLGNATDDAVGCDTVRNLGWTFNSTNNDAEYGAAPPAVGFDYFRGPIVPGGPNDSVVYYSPPGSTNRIVKHGFKELGLSAFNTYDNGDPTIGDPSNFRETYYNLQGLQKLGTQWINPQTNQPTTFAYSGDPETNTGWVMATGDDRRSLQCSGPLVVNPGDTQTIVVSQIIVRGANNLKSVTALKGLSESAQRIFDQNFQIPPPPPCPTVQSYAPGNGRIYLSWNDTLEKMIIPNPLSGGTYKFQGYNVYAVKSGTDGFSESDRQLVATYDLKDGIGDIEDSVFSAQYNNFVWTVTQKGTNNGISRYIVIDRDYINNAFLVSGTPYYFSVTGYMYDPLANLQRNLTQKVNESPISNCVITVTPQALTSGTQVYNNVGDTMLTSQRDLGVMPIVVDPLKLINAKYESVYGGSNSNPNWTLNRIAGGTTTTLYSNVADFSGEQDTAKIVNGFLLIHQAIRDTGIIKDPGDFRVAKTFSNFEGWTYDPPQNAWFEGPDSASIATAKVLNGRMFDSRSLGMCYPTLQTFKNQKSRIIANAPQFVAGSGNANMSGGPLRKIQIVFGQNSQSYRYVPTDTTYTSTPYADMVTVPFSVFAVDELDSSGGAPRQLNTAFMDADNSGTWNPNATSLGGYEFTFIMASDYSSTPSASYTTRNILLGSPSLGFPAFDVMYAWLPRQKTVNGAPLTWTNGDKLTVYPYRVTRPNFVPGYPVKYSWETNGTEFNNTSVASNEMSKIKAFPNPYFGGSSLETDPFDRFIIFSHLPQKCDIYIYTLDGVLVRKISRDNSNPNNSQERWDLQNSNQIPVASGMYVVYIDAPGVGSTTLKVAIFSPTERIQTF